MTPQASIPPGRLHQRLEHFMIEITTPEAASSSKVSTGAIPRSRHLRRVLVATTLTIAVIAATFTALSVTGGPTGTGPAAFAITPQAHGMVTIKIVNTEASAEEMTRQLHSRGLGITVETRTLAAPAAQILLASYSGRVPEDVSAAVSAQLRTRPLPAAITVPAAFPGNITLVIAVPAP